MTTTQANQLKFIYDNITSQVLSLTATPIINTYRKPDSPSSSVSNASCGGTYTASEAGYLIVTGDSPFTAGNNPAACTLSLVTGTGTPTLLSEKAMVSTYGHIAKTWVYYVPKGTQFTFNSRVYGGYLAAWWSFVLFPVG